MMSKLSGSAAVGGDGMLDFQFTPDQARYVQRLAKRYVSYRKSSSVDVDDLVSAAQIRWWQFTARNLECLDERTTQICFYQQVKGAVRDVIRNSAPVKVTRTMQAQMKAYQNPYTVDIEHALDIHAGDDMPMDRELWMDVVASLKRLPEREQIILSLYFIDGYSYSEIAEIFEVSVSTITRAYRKALDLIRQDVQYGPDHAKLRKV